MDRLRKSLPPLSCLLPFEAAARLGSFTKAAAELHLSQAAVSRQIRSLEDNVGVRLFERRNRAAILTDAGREFGRVVASALESVAAHAGHLRGNRKNGEVVFFSQLCEAFYWVMPRLSEFHREHPGIQVRIVASTKSLTEYDDDFDVALQTTSRERGDHPLVFTVSDEVFALCSPSYLAGRNSPIALADLPKHNLLHHKAHPQDWLDWDGWLARLGSNIRIGYSGTVFDSYPVMIQAAIEGHGVTLGWRRTMERLIGSGALVRPLQESVVLSDGLSVYRRQASRPRRESEALVNWLRAQLGR